MPASIDARESRLAVELNVLGITPVHLGRGLGELGCKPAVGGGRRIERDRKGGQPLAGAHVAQARIALEVTQLQQVLVVEAAAELGSKEARILGARVEG